MPIKPVNSEQLTTQTALISNNLSLTQTLNGVSFNLQISGQGAESNNSGFGSSNPSSFQDKVMEELGIRAGDYQGFSEICIKLKQIAGGANIEIALQDNTLEIFLDGVKLTGNSLLNKPNIATRILAVFPNLPEKLRAFFKPLLSKFLDETNKDERKFFINGLVLRSNTCKSELQIQALKEIFEIIIECRKEAVKEFSEAMQKHHEQVMANIKLMAEEAKKELEQLKQQLHAMIENIQDPQKKEALSTLLINLGLDIVLPPTTSKDDEKTLSLQKDFAKKESPQEFSDKDDYLSFIRSFRAWVIS